ncbi:unnamed protein product, partial [Brassica rapa subsp. trilocularis]
RKLFDLEIYKKSINESENGTDCRISVNRLYAADSNEQYTIRHFNIMI